MPKNKTFGYQHRGNRWLPNRKQQKQQRKYRLSIRKHQNIKTNKANKKCVPRIETLSKHRNEQRLQRRRANQELHKYIIMGRPSFVISEFMQQRQLDEEFQEDITQVDYLIELEMLRQEHLRERERELERQREIERERELERERERELERERQRESHMEFIRRMRAFSFSRLPPMRIPDEELYIRIPVDSDHDGINFTNEQYMSNLHTERINNIPTFKFDMNETNELTENNKQCCICFDNYVKGDDLRLLNCVHHMHKECCDKWLAEHSTCPLCRSDAFE